MSLRRAPFQYRRKMKDIFSILNLSQALRSYQETKADKSWIDTNSGKVVDFMNIIHESICIEDIAQGLSNTCRFAGQIPKFYSVAEHSVLVYRYMRRKLNGQWSTYLEYFKSGLMHDAPEGGGMGDMVTPLKNLCPGFKIIESEYERVVREVFGLEIPFSHPMIKEADWALFEIERFELRGQSPTYETKYKLPEGLRIRNLSPEEAKKEFLSCVEELNILRRPPEELEALSRRVR